MNEVDVFVGRKIRARRIELGKTQADLADGIGVKFQQVQKYETGLNRVSASRLWVIADVLRVPIGYFFEGAAAQPANDADAAADEGFASEIRSLRLMRNFKKLPEAQQSAVLEIVKSMVGDADETGDGLTIREA